MFFKKTVDSIIADITTRIEHLHVVAAAHEAEITVHNDIIALRTKLAAAAAVEMARAKRLADKFTELVS